MSVTLFALFVSNSDSVFRWLAEHGGDHVVRKHARCFERGWTMKVTLDDPSLSEMFKSRWASDLLTLDNHRKWMADGRLR